MYIAHASKTEISVNFGFLWIALNYRCFQLYSKTSQNLYLPNP